MFSTTTLIKYVVPAAIGACIIGANLLSGSRRTKVDIRKRKAIKDALAEMRVKLNHVQEDDENPFDYIIIMGIQMDVGYEADEMPIYWEYAYQGIYTLCKETNPRLADYWCYCDKVAIMVDGEEHMQKLSKQCKDRKINCVIIDGSNSPGDDPDEPKMKLIAIGPCLRRDFEEFNEIYDPKLADPK